MGHEGDEPGEAPAKDHDKAQRDFRINRTEQLASRARRTEQALNRLEVVDKPWEGWDLRFTIGETLQGGAVVARLEGAVVQRGDFRLGPVDLEISRSNGSPSSAPTDRARRLSSGPCSAACRSSPAAAGRVRASPWASWASVGGRLSGRPASSMRSWRRQASILRGRAPCSPSSASVPTT